jgi:plastocyanin
MPVVAQGRRRLPAFALAFVLAATSSGAAPGELRGTARIANRPVADVVVWLESPSVAVPSATPQPVLDQRNLQFMPHVLVVSVGTTVKFPNSDRVFHNVFSFHDGRKFDLGVYPIGAVKYVTFDRAGVSRLFCNIHPNMAGYVVAVDSPYFATSGDNGAFTVHAPPGRYTYHAWRAGAPILSGSVTLDGLSPLEIQWP